MVKKEGYMGQYMTQRYHRRRQEAIEKLGGRCVECGTVDNLELDHRDPTEKEWQFAKILSTGSDEKVAKELTKAQLLCKPCHRIKSTLEKGQTPAKGTHGTLSSYRYCRCDVCKKAMSDYNKSRSEEHNKKRREKRKCLRDAMGA